nr:hypothetical protein [uncultured Psychrobacter sp.]
MMAHLGLDVPEPPSFDASIQDVIQTFYLVDRGRNYTEGQPLPISVKNITDVVSVHPIDVPRSVLDSIIFELDNLVLNEVAENNKKAADKA